MNKDQMWYAYSGLGLLAFFTVAFCAGFQDSTGELEFLSAIAACALLLTVFGLYQSSKAPKK